MAESHSSTRPCDVESRLSLVESDVRWDESDVRPDFSDARLTLGYCLGVETEVELVPPDEASSGVGETSSTMSEEYDRRTLVNGDARDGDLRTTESGGCASVHDNDDDEEITTKSSDNGGVCDDVDLKLYVSKTEDKFMDSSGKNSLESDEVCVDEGWNDDSLDLDVLDRFDVIAGIASECDVTGRYDTTRPDIMEDCHFGSSDFSSVDSMPDIADVCDIVLELEESVAIKPDIADINEVKLYQLESDEIARGINQCETRPDLVEYSDVTVNNLSVDCSVPPDISEQCVSQSKVSRHADVSLDTSVVSLEGSRQRPDVIVMGDVHPVSEDLNHLDSLVVIVDVEANSDDESRPGSVGHLLKLVRALASNLGTDVATPSGGNTNMGFEDTESLGSGRLSGDQASQASSNEDIDWSWLADETQLCSATSSRPSSWLRASMRRVRRFALGESQARVATAPPHPHASTIPVRCSAPPGTTHDDGNRVPTRARSVSHVPTPDTDTASSPRVSNVNATPARSQSVNHRPSSSHIPDILNSVNTTRSIVPPNRCIDAAEVDPAPSAPPPESPRSPARDPDDFPRRYSHLGRLEGRRPEETPEQPSEPTTEDESNSDYDEPEETKDWWPHSLSSLLASLGCTLGLFNVSRFAILSVHFGANFVIQFLFLSVVVGWPLYTLHASLGQHLKAGVVDMWRISPLFQGIGIALLMAQAMLGLYSVVGVAWMFTYFRDSFINKYDAYRWAENGTKVEDSVPEYLNTVVLQRQGSSTVGHLKFQVTFNLAVVWMIVFVCLSKGVKSYGKSVYLFATVPIFGISILAIKVLTLTDIWFDHTAWNELFVNTNCWTAAAIECMMTWGLLGAATMQMRSHSACCRLSRECLAVGAITVATLVSAALLANGFAQLLWTSNLRYVPSSFEHSAVFLSPVGAPRLSSTPVRWMSHAHHMVGLQVTVPGASIDTVSGYQAAQFATELAPAVFAKLGPQAVSPFWTVLFYFTLILLGISQQLCIWHCVITGIMAINITRLRSWETTITFLSCSCGFVLGLPMTTELGIAVVYFMDYCVGGAWWLILLQSAQIVAALMAQGGEQVAHTLLGSRRSCLQAFVVFTWNVVLPLALTVVSVTWFRSNHYRDLYSSRHHGYWPAWARRLGCLLQLVPLIIVPLVAAVQTWRYLTKGPSDLFDRLRLLCRPGPTDSLVNHTTTPTVSSPSQPLPEMTAVDDPPPKYTPPPSYSTATGARIAKLLRRSFRRLVGPPVPSPPDYSAVLVEMGGAEIVGRTSTMSAVEVAHILRSSMRRTLRREQVRSAPSPMHDSSKTEPVI